MEKQDNLFVLSTPDSSTYTKWVLDKLVLANAIPMRFNTIFTVADEKISETYNIEHGASSGLAAMLAGRIGENDLAIAVCKTGGILGALAPFNEKILPFCPSNAKQTAELRTLLGFNTLVLAANYTHSPIGISKEFLNTEFDATPANIQRRNLYMGRYYGKIL